MSAQTTNGLPWLRWAFRLLRGTLVSVPVAAAWEPVMSLILVGYATAPLVRAALAAPIARAFRESHLQLPLEVRHLFRVSVGTGLVALIGALLLHATEINGFWKMSVILTVTVVCLLMIDSSLAAARGVGLPALVDRVRLRWLAERLLTGAGVSPRWLGSASGVDFHPGVQLLAAVVLVCSFGAVGAEGPTRGVLAAAGGVFEKKVGEPSPRADIESQNDVPRTAAHPAPGVSVSIAPSVEPSSSRRPTAADICGYGPLGKLQARVPTAAGKGLAAAYSEQGAEEIGCPDSGATAARGGIYYADLRGGEDDPALVVSDSAGNAAVVFTPLVAATKRLIERGALMRLGPRTSTGLGEYQVRYLRGGRCSLALRSTYSSGYEFLSPSASSLVIETSVAFRSVPIVTRLGANRLSLAFVDAEAGAPTPTVLTIRLDNRDAVLLETTRRGHPNRSCSGVEELEQLALTLFNRMTVEESK